MPEQTVAPLDGYRLVLAFVACMLVFGAHAGAYFGPVRDSLADHQRHIAWLLAFIATGVMGFGGGCVLLATLFSRDRMWTPIVRLLTWHRMTSLVVQDMHTLPCPPCDNCVVRSFALTDTVLNQCIWVNMTCAVTSACPYSLRPVVYVGPHNAVVLGEITITNSDVWRLVGGGTALAVSLLCALACRAGHHVGDRNTSFSDDEGDMPDSDCELDALVSVRRAITPVCESPV